MLWRMGVELECGTRLGVDYQLDDLTAEYDAVFLGLGALDSPPSASPATTPGRGRGARLLGDDELAGDVSVGDRVAVVGDGFAAVEACRIAVRKGAREVTLTVSRPRQAMAAPAAEVAAAEEEGVQVALLVAPLRISSTRATS